MSAPDRAGRRGAVDGTALREPRRRQAVAWIGGLCVPALSRAQPDLPALAPASVVDVLRAGGVAVLLRHAATTPGVGDPPDFRLGDCATQRNLSDEGRAQARRIGAWFARHRLAPAAVRSSAWCRCIDTARLAFGRDEPWPVLDSFFGSADAGATRLRMQSIDAALRALPAGRFEVWVTHQVNATEAGSVFLGMGEGLLLRAGGDGEGPPARPAVLARLSFDA